MKTPITYRGIRTTYGTNADGSKYVYSTEPLSLTAPPATDYIDPSVVDEAISTLKTAISDAIGLVSTKVLSVATEEDGSPSQVINGLSAAETLQGLYDSIGEIPEALCAALALDQIGPLAVEVHDTIQDELNKQTRLALEPYCDAGSVSPTSP